MLQNEKRKLGEYSSESSAEIYLDDTSNDMDSEFEFYPQPSEFTIGKTDLKELKAGDFLLVELLSVELMKKNL